VGDDDENPFHLTCPASCAPRRFPRIHHIHEPAIRQELLSDVDERIQDLVLARHPCPERRMERPERVAAAFPRDGSNSFPVEPAENLPLRVQPPEAVVEVGLCARNEAPCGARDIAQYVNDRLAAPPALSRWHARWTSSSGAARRSFTPWKTSADVFWAREEQELFWAETSLARQRPNRPAGRSRS
jgi:hypothetical protein